MKPHCVKHLGSGAQYWLASTVKSKVPGAVGVPCIVPSLSIFRPGAISPASTQTAYGGAPAFSTNLNEYGVPTTPGGGG